MPFDDQSELFYHVDENDKVLGSISRAEAHRDKSKIHRSIFVAIFNDQHQILLQKRSQHKDLYPGLWSTSVGGHVTYGQTYRQAAKREMTEELGLSLPITRITKAIIKTDRETEYVAGFTAQLQTTPSKFDKVEIDEVAWFSASDVTKLIKQRQITPSCKMDLKLVEYL